MKREQFLLLQKEDILSYLGVEFEVAFVDSSFDREMGIHGAYRVEDDAGASFAITDNWLDDVEVVHMTHYDMHPPYLKRLEYIVLGIDADVKAWDFIEEAIHDVIESYGGRIVDID